MTTVVIFGVLCFSSLQIALCLNLLDPLFRIASLGWGETPATSTRDIVLRHGFRAETHKLTADDGYIIHMTRIIGEKGKTGKRTKLPVLLMHGLLSSSDHWVLKGRNNDLPLLLAELGHDVWLGDWRGNTYSRGHTFLPLRTPTYWNFTYFHRAQHDLPAFINRVLLVSKAPQLFYIGYSYGTTAVMVLGSEIPEYQNKIKRAILLAPVGYRMHHMYPKIKLTVNGLMKYYGNTTSQDMFELFPREATFLPVMRTACSSRTEFCMRLLFELFGQREENIDEESFQNLLPLLPSGASSLDVIYLGQIFAEGFRAYDFGTDTNLRVYGQKKPPDVPIKTNCIPMALYYSPQDHLNSEKGVLELSRRLCNVTFVKKIPIANFSHLDYMIGRDVKRYLYDDIINVIEHTS